MRFEYPTTINSPEQKLGQNNTVGFYPIGRLFNWHGGLHVNERSTGTIKAIADGVVIAYRISEKPHEINGLKVSNSFVLVRHKYTSPQGRELPFFSLYNHLMTYDELKADNKVPVLFEETQYEVNGKKIVGLNARSSSNNKNTYVVPLGMKVKLDKNLTKAEKDKNHWAHNSLYKKIIYTDPYSGEIVKDHFMYIRNNYNTKIDEDTYQITTLKAYRDSGNAKGENVRDIESSEIKYVVPNNTIIKVDGFTDSKKNYYKIKSIDGKAYTGLKIWSQSLKKSSDKALGQPFKLNEVVTGEDCDIVVKAGDTIGFAGLCGFSGQENYRSCHVEVFTDEDPTEFLKGVSGDVNDVKDTKKYAKIKQGAVLKLQYPVTLKKDDEIKVLDFTEDENKKYCRIKLHKQTREVNKDDLKFKEQKKQSDTLLWAKYTPKNLKVLNKQFQDTLKKDSVIDWVEMLADEDGKKRRKVSFTLPAGDHIYWVKKTDLGISSKPEAPMILTSDLTTLFKKEPQQEKTEFSLGHNYIQSKAELKKSAISVGDKTWYHIKTLTPVKNEYGFVYYERAEGLIKSDDSNILEVSAFDWETFGFKVYSDQPDTFVYKNSIKPLEELSPPAFLKSVWSHIDKNGDGKLSNRELKTALSDQFTQQKLSKMICYHQSEWGVDFGALKSEVEVLLDEGIELEKDPAEKQKLQQEKETILNTVEQKINTFNFWENIKYPEITLKEPNGFQNLKRHIPTEFKLNNNIKLASSVFPVLKAPELNKLELPEIPEIEVNWKKIEVQPKFWHFNPVAFVEQMKRMDTGLRYEIHHTGKIVQYGVYKDAKEVSYMYVDNNGERHNLGIWKLIEADKYANGTKAKIDASKCHSEYSSYYKRMIYYRRLDGKIKLLNFKDKKVDYSKGSLSISYHFKSSINRKYVDPEAFAVLIGALAELGSDYADVTINGFTDVTGTGSPSVTHPRGINFDMRLLNKSKKVKPLLISDVDLDIERNNKLLDALYKFGYTQSVSNYYKSKKLLNHCVKDRRGKHKDHLHVQGYKPNIEKR